MADGPKSPFLDGLKAAAGAALRAGAATGAARAFPKLLEAVQAMGEAFSRRSIGKLLHEVPRARAAELVTMIGQAFARGVARGAGLPDQ